MFYIRTKFLELVSIEYKLTNLVLWITICDWSVCCEKKKTNLKRSKGRNFWFCMTVIQWYWLPWMIPHTHKSCQPIANIY